MAGASVTPTPGVSVIYNQGCLITDISDGITAIKYLRKKDHTSSAFIWPEIDDVEYFYTDEDILAVLPQPTPGRRGEIIFLVSFASFNTQ